MGKTVMLAETADHKVMMVEYNPLQFTFRAAALVMQDEFGITFVAFAAIHVSDDGASHQIASMKQTAHNSRQVT